MSKVEKLKLTTEQKKILFEEGTEPSGSSSLNNEKERAVIIVLDVEPNYSNLKKNMKAEVAGLPFLSLCLMCLKLK